MKKFGVIINTDSYAGNFERELCAWCTGCIGECTVGEEYVDEGIKEIFEDIIYQQSDEHGCHRPVEIYDDNDDKFNSLIIYFTEKPSEEKLNIIRKRANSFNDAVKRLDPFYKDYPDKVKNIKILNIRIQ